MPRRYVLAVGDVVVRLWVVDPKVGIHNKETIPMQHICYIFHKLQCGLAMHHQMHCYTNCHLRPYHLQMTTLVT